MLYFFRHIRRCRNPKPVKKLKRIFAKIASVEVDLEETTARYTKESTARIVGVLQAAEFEAFLLSTLGGERNKEYAERSMRCTARFLQWSHYSIKNAPLPEEDALAWLSTVIKKEYKVLLSYSNHLVAQLSRTPSTVKNHILEIINCCEWFTFYAPGDSRLNIEALAGIKHVAKAVRRSQRRKQKRTRSHSTMASEVNDRRMPAGGLAQLQAAVEARMTWALNMCSENIDKQTFKTFMCLLYAALYVFSVQGRQSGVMDMTYQQGWELLRRGYSTSTQFKTASKWQLQPVTLSEVSMRLLSLYLQHIRPQLERSIPCDTDPLWLDFEGQPEKQIGKRVSEFFRKSLGLHITTTSIRSLIETTMDSMYRRGEISNEEKTAVHTINGHSSSVAKDYYVQVERASDVYHARQAFSRLTGGSSSGSALNDYYAGNEDFNAAVEEEYAADLPIYPDNNNTSSGAAAHGPGSPPHHLPLPLPLPLPAQAPQVTFTGLVANWQQHDAFVPADWGSAHPDYGKTTRARWTDDEVNYIGRFCENLSVTNPYANTVVAQCLHRIKQDPAALSIFHEIHVLDSGRLRNGYRIYQARRAEHQL